MGENTFTSYLTQQLGVKGDPIKRGQNTFTSYLTQQRGVNKWTNDMGWKYAYLFFDPTTRG